MLNRIFLAVIAVLFSLSTVVGLSQNKTTAQSKNARFVRIELPGSSRILTLAEVEVFSNGKNVASNGKATQSSTHGNAVASRAIDGNKDSDYNKGGQTHTTDDGSSNAWWELDLQSTLPLEKIAIWNRKGFEGRLDGFTLTLQDADKKEVLRAINIAAGEVIEFDIIKNGAPSYLTYAGKPGQSIAQSKTAKNGSKSDAKKSQPKVNEPALAEVPAGYRDPAPFAFQKDDVVAILGNGLPDRMQHDGWLETLLQGSLRDKKVRFRNMSASGDQPDSFPRSKGATPMMEYLQYVKADVVLAFFGYNESYDGVAKAGEYQKRLEAFVKRVRGTKPNGRSFPRIVQTVKHTMSNSKLIPKRPRPQRKQRELDSWIYFIRHWKSSRPLKPRSPSMVCILRKKAIVESLK
jgi:hypothetical protein